MEGARLLVMRTIPTIEMIPSSEKRVRQVFCYSPSNRTDMGISTSVRQLPHG
jgi:hypothetical protein